MHACVAAAATWLSTHPASLFSSGAAPRGSTRSSHSKCKRAAASGQTWRVLVGMQVPNKCRFVGCIGNACHRILCYLSTLIRTLTQSQFQTLIQHHTNGPFSLRGVQDIIYPGRTVRQNTVLPAVILYCTGYLSFRGGHTLYSHHTQHHILYMQYNEDFRA